MRIFVTTPSVKSGSTLLAWLIKRHSYLNHTDRLLEQIELGSMLNVLDHIPEWRRLHGEYGQAVGNPDMIEKIVNFTDSIINPENNNHCIVKFTNFSSFRWLSHVFPNDKFVVIVRDIYDWFASVKVWNTSRHTSWDMHHVGMCINKAANSLTVLPDIKVVHFEDLINDPRPVMSKVYNYLGLPDEPISLDGHEDIFKMFSCKPTIIEPINNELLFKSPIGRASELTEAEIASISKLSSAKNIISLYSDERKL